MPSLDPLPCSDTIQDGGVVDIAISATNVLGTGPASEAIQVGTFFEMTNFKIITT